MPAQRCTDERDGAGPGAGKRRHERLLDRLEAVDAGQRRGGLVPRHAGHEHAKAARRQRLGETGEVTRARDEAMPEPDRGSRSELTKLHGIERISREGAEPAVGTTLVFFDLFAAIPERAAGSRLWSCPRPSPAGRPGSWGGRVVFLDPTGGYTLDVDAKLFSATPVPEELRSCWSAATHVIEAARVVVLSPAACHGGTVAVSAFDPRHGTWKTAKLPPVPPPRAPPGKPVSDYKEKLAWTGEHVIVWTSTYQVSGPDLRCANAPRGMGCDPVGPPVALVANDGFILQPSL